VSAGPVNIPQLDIRLFDQGDAAQRNTFVAALRASLREFGFVGIREHGMGEAVVARAYAALERLFALPLETKLAYHEPSRAGERGYTAFGVERAKDSSVGDLKEFWHVGRELDPGSPGSASLPQNIWPDPALLPDFRPALLALYAALDALSQRMLSAIALSLELPADWFVAHTQRGNSIVRPIHYPALADPAANPPGAVRAAAHGDINLITLLVGSGEPGLELRSREGGWIPVSTIEGVVVCNVGDILQRLTNHVLPSTIHRVVNPPEPWASQPRYSVPFFVHPNPEFMVETLPQCVSADNPNRYPEPINADVFLHQRLRENGLK